MKILNITRVATAAGIAGALVVAAIAYASANKTPASQPITANVTDPATLLKFEHARVVNATPEELASLAREAASRPETSVGQRAYLDADTRQLRPAFPEELAAEAAAARIAAAASPAPVLHETTMANGVTRVVLDESSMSYAVARIESDGSVKSDCVTDQPSEKAALNAAVAAPGVDKNEK
jgi:hypothetical protein